MKTVDKAIIGLAAITALVWAGLSIPPKTVEKPALTAEQAAAEAGARLLGEPGPPTTIAWFPVATGVRAGQGLAVTWRHEGYCMTWLTVPGSDITQWVHYSGLMTLDIRDTLVKECSGRQLPIYGYYLSDDHPCKVYWKRSDSAGLIPISVEPMADGAAARIDTPYLWPEPTVTASPS